MGGRIRRWPRAVWSQRHRPAIRPRIVNRLRKRRVVDIGTHAKNGESGQNFPIIYSDCGISRMAEQAQFYILDESVTKKMPSGATSSLMTSADGEINRCTS